MKIVAFDEVYNFVVQSFPILSHLHSQMINILSRSEICIVYRLFEYEDDFK
jgi:hypothetical protein